MPDQTNPLCATCSGQQADRKWQSISVKHWRDSVLPRAFEYKPDKTDPKYPTFSNIAYNLQYLEYLDKCFAELYLTSVIRSQLVKTFVLTTSQIIECLLNLKLVEMGVDSSEIWEFSKSLRAGREKNAFALGQQYYRNELYRLNGNRNKIHLQSAANIEEADFMAFNGTDILNDTKNTLFIFMQKCLKMPGDEMMRQFYFLRPTEDFLHTKND